MFIDTLIVGNNLSDATAGINCHYILEQWAPTWSDLGQYVDKVLGYVCGRWLKN
jgi:hypothetical protein